MKKKLKIPPCLPSITIDPSLVADKDEREPRNPPIGVRATPTMQTSTQNKPASICF